MSEDKRDAIVRAEMGIRALKRCKESLSACDGDALQYMIQWAQTDKVRETQELIRKTITSHFIDGSEESTRYMGAADFYFTDINLSYGQKYDAVHAKIHDARMLMDAAIESLEERILRMKGPRPPATVIRTTPLVQAPIVVLGPDAASVKPPSYLGSPGVVVPTPGQSVPQTTPSAPERLEQKPADEKPILVLKPTFMGMSIDLNELWRRWRSKPPKRK